MKLYLEPTPGDSIHDCAEQAQNMANHFDITVQFRFNGSDCLAVPTGRSDWMVTNFAHRRENGLVASNREPETEQQWPPAGMAIQVYRNGAWQMAHTLNNMGTAQWGLSSLRLPNEVWRYLPAPQHGWNLEGVECWCVTSMGEMFFDTAHRQVGDIIGNRFCRTIVHVEYRPEGSNEQQRP